MTSKIKVDNINKVSDDSNIIKKCGTTTTIGSGASNPIVVDGSAITLGRCGGTVALASGATQTGFGRTGTVDWQTTIKTGDFTASSGEGYFVNTTSGEVDVTLPAGSAGSIVAVADYANTADTNNIILKQNGSDKIEGSTDNFIINQEGAATTLIFADSTKGWIVTDTGNSSNSSQALFVAASGGTITTSGNFKIHTFTGPGTFTVCSAGNSVGSNTVSYMVVAGGGGGGGSAQTPNDAGTSGGGAGGYREGKASTDSYTASPLNAPAGLPVSVQGYPIAVGGGGAGTSSSAAGSKGVNSTFSTITSAGGGGGGGYQVPEGQACKPIAALQGGSGGGGGTYQNSPGQSGSGTGNQPPVSPPQGNDGGNGTGGRGGAGGGGAGAVGTNGSPSNAGAGGNGVASEITASPVTRGGGGGGASMPGSAAPGGTGGGGDGSNTPGGSSAGTANTGGGGAGGGKTCANNSANGKAGGSGIVVIRYKFQ